ncbi:putative ABC transporter ATP-binding protein YxlF [Phycisphaerae bacterium RAS2]|nr:putative ABC transporter ATP-binding protein YxlF [Phycisphaerae bacterium RAS2]
MTLVLDAQRLRVDYGRFTALSDFSLQLSAGHLLGLIGPNGAGKTTSLKAMCGIVPVTAGRVTILGDELTITDPLVRSRCGFAPDTPPVYDELTVAQFLEFIGRAHRIRLGVISERIDFWLEQLWLHDRRNSKIKSLSRGMKQRLTVARTLLPDPPLVLLDEPAAGLDPAGRVAFRKMLASLRDQGKALIVSSHILADLHEYCTHIGIMQGGRMMQFGTVAQVVGAKEDNRCRWEVTLARQIHDVAGSIGAIPGLTALEVHGRQVSFEYEHDDQAAADLLAKFLDAGLPVARFAPVEHDLEQAYLRTGIRQVD